MDSTDVSKAQEPVPVMVVAVEQSSPWREGCTAQRQHKTGQESQFL
ncbi:MAG: hypothetical protein R3E96_10035 [Planctomycetota bacterium]